ncbi:uncharacterized protein G2W53_029350 [Senna tora]|uniref:Uncharacterized protein n=1 Tax=Senna tora TaxID=362788 RepID=A0A834T5A1_9FABA|nr:uncharacterized protein G2W53_029350 [Senna tora]
MLFFTRHNSTDPMITQSNLMCSGSLITRSVSVLFSGDSIQSVGSPNRPLLTPTSKAMRESPVAVVTGTSESVEKAFPSSSQEHSTYWGEIPWVASRSVNELEVAPDEHNGLDSVVLQTRSTLTSTNDLQNIWDLCFAPFKREILSGLEMRHPDGSFWFDSEGESLFLSKWIEPNSNIPRPELKNCSDESLRTISTLANLGPPKKLRSLLITGEDGFRRQNIAQILASAKGEEAKKGQTLSIPHEGTLAIQQDRSSSRSAQLYNTSKKIRSPSIGEGSVIRAGSGRSGSTKGSTDRRVFERRQKGKDVEVYKDPKPQGFVHLESLTSPLHLVPPGAKREVPLLGNDRSEYYVASLIRNRMSCLDDQAAIENFGMVNWYAARLEDVSQAHEDCKCIAKVLGKRDKALEKLMSEMSSLNSKKDNAVGEEKLLESQLDGSEHEALNLK